MPKGGKKPYYFDSPEDRKLLARIRRENVRRPNFGQHEPGYLDRLRTARQVRDAQQEYGNILEGLAKVPALALRRHATQELVERGDALRAFLAQAQGIYRAESLPRGPLPGSRAAAEARRKIA